MADETSQIKVKVTADGAAQAATQVDKLTASLEKQRRSQEMLAKTSEQLRRQNRVDELKKEAAAVNGLTDAVMRQQQASAGASASLGSFGDNSKQLRQHLSPAAALVGNLSNSFSVLMPEAGGASKALQVAGLAGSQMLGVLGGGPGILLGGLVAAVGALASYFANAKTEADALAKATEANAKAMGTYLDQVDKLRAGVSAKYDQAKNNKDARSKILTGEEQNPDTIAKELEYQRERLKNPYYRNAEKDARALSRKTGSYELGDDLLNTRKAEARAILDDIAAMKERLKASKEAVELTKQQKKDKLDVEGDILSAGGLPEDKKKKENRGDMNVPDSIRKIDEMIVASQEKVKDYEKQQSMLGFEDWKTQQEQKAAFEQKARDDKFVADTLSRKQEQQDFAEHMQQLAASRKIYQDLATQSSNIVAGAAIKSFQMIAKGQKAEIGAILEGIGDQIVAMGTGYIFKGIAESILLNPQGPALIGVGTAAVGFGIGLGAVGARGAGGSTATGGGAAAANANPYGANPYSNPQSPVAAATGPTIINITMPTVLTPSAEDGLRIKQAIDASTRVYGR